jgi:hypothetical protein
VEALILILHNFSTVKVLIAPSIQNSFATIAYFRRFGDVEGISTIADFPSGVL